LIDNFDGPKKLEHWTFSNGAEFPGASGKLSLGPGHEGRGAVLAIVLPAWTKHIVALM
jgi:hypothetical protein